MYCALDFPNLFPKFFLLPRCKLNDSVCVMDGIRKRGYVMRLWKNETAVALVDHATVLITPSCTPIPEELVKIPAAGVRCILHAPVIEGTKLVSYFFLTKFTCTERIKSNLFLKYMG